MADNYLERRMEDLKNGRSAPALRPNISNWKGVFSIPFPTQKVLIDVPDSKARLQLIRSLIKTGSKVAVIEKDVEKGRLLAHDEGARVYSAGSDKEILADLYHEWQKVTVIVCGADRLPSLSMAWKEIIESLNIPSFHAPRLITLKPEQDNHFPESLSRHDIACNDIVVSEEALEKAEIAERFSRLCLFLSVPGNAYIRNLTFHMEQN